MLTQYELICFSAANDIDNVQLSPLTNECRDAIIASKGGKGLLLSQVAMARNIIGHLMLSDILTVHVFCVLPDEEQFELDNNSRHDSVIDDAPDDEVKQNEFWKDSSFYDDDCPRSMKWCKLKQDVLKIQTIHNRTLCLRFYSDMEEDSKNIINDCSSSTNTTTNNNE